MTFARLLSTRQHFPRLFRHRFAEYTTGFANVLLYSKKAPNQLVRTSHTRFSSMRVRVLAHCHSSGSKTCSSRQLQRPPSPHSELYNYLHPTCANFFAALSALSASAVLSSSARRARVRSAAFSASTPASRSRSAPIVAAPPAPMGPSGAAPPPLPTPPAPRLPSRKPSSK